MITEHAKQLVLASVITVAACSPSRPPHGVVTAAGSAWAQTPELAAGLAEDVALLTPHVRRFLGETRDVVPEVWLQEDLAAYRWWSAGEHLDGLVPSHGRRVHLRALPSGDAPGTLVLVHELAHLLLITDVRLPWAIEEALCDVMSDTVVGGQAASAARWWHQLFAWCGVTGRTPEFAIEVDLPGEREPVRIGRVPLDGVPDHAACRPACDVFSARHPPSDLFCNRVERGLTAFVLTTAADRMGVQEALGLMQERALAPGSPDWLEVMAMMAGLPSDPATWEQPILHALADGHAAVAFAVGYRHGEGGLQAIPDRTMRLLASAYPGSTPQALFERGRPRIRLMGTPVTASVDEIPWLRERFERDWPASVDSTGRR